MAEQEQSPATFTDFVTALYDDPIRAETARRGRWLVGLALAIFLVTLFGAEFRPESLLSVAFPKDSGAVRGALAFVVLLLWVEFALRAFTDWFREKELRLVVTRYVDAQKEARQVRDAREADEQEPDFDEQGNPDPEPDPWWEPVIVTRQEMRRRMDKLQGQLGERAIPRLIRASRVWLEIGIPLGLGLLALWISRDALTALMTTIASAIC